VVRRNHLVRPDDAIDDAQHRCFDDPHAKIAIIRKAVLISIQSHHDDAMGRDRTDQAATDLFSTTNPVRDEARRRGRLPRNFETAPSSGRRSDSTTKPMPPTDKRRKVDIAEISLTQGQVNAVRAAFSGITPSRIARQFGISQSDVRKAVAGYPSR
jgi:hypothetical protein